MQIEGFEAYDIKCLFTQSKEELSNAIKAYIKKIGGFCNVSGKTIKFSKANISCEITIEKMPNNTTATEGDNIPILYLKVKRKSGDRDEYISFMNHLLNALK